MEELRIKFKDLFFIFLLCMFGIAAFTYLFMTYGNTVMPVEEFVYDRALEFGTNAVAENKLFWILVFGGGCLIALYKLFIDRNMVKTEVSAKPKSSDLFLYFSVIIIAGLLLYDGNFIFYILPAGCAMVIRKAFFKDFGDNAVNIYILLTSMVFIFCYFVFEAINYAYIIHIYVISSILCFILLICAKKIGRNSDNKILLFLQCCLPLTLSVYLKDTYTFRGNEIKIENSLNFTIFVYLLISLFTAFQIYYAYKKRDSDKRGEVSIVSSIIILGIMSVLPMSKSVNDSHHTAEMVISFRQVFVHHNIPYVNYFPVSGAFPIIFGALIELLDLKLVGADIVRVLSCFMTSAVAALLLKGYLKNKHIFWLSAIFCFANVYIRTNMILLYTLVLFHPKLREKSGYWLLAWVIMSYITIFFYPVFGVGILIGTCPLVMWQLKRFFVNGEYKIHFKSKIFTVILLLEMLVMSISVPAILGLIRHILVYSQSSNVANAWGTFGQKVPKEFLGILPGMKAVKAALWYSVRYLAPLFVIWTLILVLCIFIKNKKFNLDKEENVGTYMTLSTLVFMLIACTLSIKKLNPNSFLMRTGFVMFPAVSVPLVLVMNAYIKKTRTTAVILGLVVSIFFMQKLSGVIYMPLTFTRISDIDIQEESGKSLEGFERFEYMSDERASVYPFLGGGFITEDIVDNIDSVKNNLAAFDTEKTSFMGLDLAYIYIFDLKTVGQPSFFALNTYASTKEEVQRIEKYKPVIFEMDVLPARNHYLYKWLLTSDSYVYVEKQKAFVPVELAKELGMQVSDKSEAFEYYTDDRRFSSNAGKSFATMKNNYMESNAKLYVQTANSYTEADTNVCSTEIKFDRDIYGVTEDYLYLELMREGKNTSNLDDIDDALLKKFTKEYLNENCTVKISWESEKSEKSYMECKLDDGRLLIPLGQNKDWLLNRHENLTVSVSGLNKDEKVGIKQCKFYISKDLK